MNYRCIFPAILVFGLGLPMAGSRAADIGNWNASAPVVVASAKGSLMGAILESTFALTNGQTPPPPQSDAYAVFSSSMQYSFGVPPADPKWTNWIYTRNPKFWLNEVKGLDAINVFPYQMQLALITPRHCLTVEHMGGCGSNVMVCFVGTNNTIYWRRSLGTVAIGKGLRACILDSPVPIAPLPVIALSDLTDKITLLSQQPAAFLTAKTMPSIAFNQFWHAWVGDTYAASEGLLYHRDRSAWLNGWSWAVTNNPAVGGGDSGSARCVVIDHQFYLIGVTAYVSADQGLNDIDAINAALDQLSAQTRQPTNHVVRLDVRKYSAF